MWTLLVGMGVTSVNQLGRYPTATPYVDTLADVDLDGSANRDTLALRYPITGSNVFASYGASSYCDGSPKRYTYRNRRPTSPHSNGNFHFHPNSFSYTGSGDNTNLASKCYAPTSA